MAHIGPVDRSRIAFSYQENRAKPHAFWCNIAIASLRIRTSPRIKTGVIKTVTDLTMIYFISPKQPTNLQANLRIVQLVKRLASNRKVVGSIPAQTTGFLGLLFLFPKKKYVRAFSQPESTNQPVTIFSTGRSEKRKSQHSWLANRNRDVKVDIRSTCMQQSGAVQTRSWM